VGCEASYTTESACEAASGVWGGEGPCCDPPAVGSCCECGECSDDVNEKNCDPDDFTEDGECASTECTAACYTTPASNVCGDTCQELTESDCDAAGGLWMPGYSCSGGGDCPAIVDLGYCCINGSCNGELMPQSECDGLLGNWKEFPVCCGDGTVMGCGGVPVCVDPPDNECGSVTHITPCTNITGMCDCCGGGPGP